MPALLALVIGVLTAAGVYLMLRRNLLRKIFGLVLLSNAVNLLVFTVGRAARVGPPLVPEGATLPVEPYANPLPQALVLTAIVIGFGLVAYALVLVYRSYATLGTMDAEQLEGGACAEDAPDTNGIPEVDIGDAVPVARALSFSPDAQRPLLKSL